MKIDGILTEAQEKAGLYVWRWPSDGMSELMMFTEPHSVASVRVAWFIPDTKPEYIRASADFYLTKEGLKK